MPFFAQKNKTTLSGSKREKTQAHKKKVVSTNHTTQFIWFWAAES